jgi:hypothetical protein
MKNSSAKRPIKLIKDVASLSYQQVKDIVYCMNRLRSSNLSGQIIIECEKKSK